MSVTTADRFMVTECKAAALPRLGFIGTGWIGRLRMRALLDANLATFCAVHDCSAAAQAAAAMNANTTVPATIDDLMTADLNGIVIATPSALHAEQCISALANGKAVFCQKPLARTHAETTRVIDTARTADKLLVVDFSYRCLAGMARTRGMINAGELGKFFAADLTFHNAYGPDKPWFYDVTTAGGGCVMDLGILLVDLAFWLLGDGEACEVSSQLFHRGKKLQPPYHVVEDYGVEQLNGNSTYDPQVEQVLKVVQVIDRIYGR